jgi:hypothetical protein
VTIVKAPSRAVHGAGRVVTRPGEIVEVVCDIADHAYVGVERDLAAAIARD